MNSSLANRFQEMGSKSIVDDLVLESGDIGDYHKLSEHHYLAGRPATFTRVFVYRYCKASAVERFLGSGEGARVVAVLVESMPVINCQMRDVALDGRYKRWGNLGDRARIVSKEIRTISRVVVHPQFRSLGLARKLVEHLLGDSLTVYTEALAAMGHVHPFFKSAGMVEYMRSPRRWDMRLLQVLKSTGLVSDAAELSSVSMGEIKSLDSRRQRWVLVELGRWYRSVCCQDKGEVIDAERQLLFAQRKILYQPVYYLFDRRSGLGKAG